MSEEELNLIKSALIALQARQVSAFGVGDPAIDALLEKLNAPAPEPAPDPAPVKKGKK